MKESAEYDVLKLIKHGQMCYVSSGCVTGCPLPRWLKYHPRVNKEELFRIVNSMVTQLSQIHRCRGNPCYRYVNPCSIVLSEEGELYYLDVNAEGNAAQLRRMMRRDIREYFLPPEEAYYQRESEELDIYGLGRTLQYLLARTETEPPLRRREEKKFQKIISRCLNRHSKRTFQKVSEIQKLIPEWKQSEKIRRGSGRSHKAARAVAVIAAVASAGGIAAGAAGSLSPDHPVEKEESDRTKTVSGEMPAEVTMTEDVAGGVTENVTEEATENDSVKLNLELGALYFLKLNDYEKSRKYFENAGENRLAQSLAVAADSLGGGSVEPGRLRQALKAAEEETGAEAEEEIGDRMVFYRCILKGYGFLDEKEDAENVIRIGGLCLEDAKTGSPEERSGIIGSMARAYELLGKNAESAKAYEEQIACEEDENVREELYSKSSELFVKSGQPDQAQRILREGIRAFPDSAGLRTDFVRTMTQDPSMEREICIQEIQQQVAEMPRLMEEEEFQKIIKEYGLKAEGEKVW